MKALKKYTEFFFQALEIIFFQMLSIFYMNNKKYRNLWLFCERGFDAQDNAFLFFKYIAENYSEKNITYILNSKDNKNYSKVNKFGRVILLNSFEHKMAFTLCNKALSTHIGYVEPWNLRVFKIFNFRSPFYVFMQHGITYNDISKVFNNKFAPINLITVSSESEIAILTDKNHNYKPNQLGLTGFARYDRLLSSNSIPKNNIVFMPTWRRELINVERFLLSDYFLKIKSLLSNPNLIELLEQSNYTLSFIMHPELNKYAYLFQKINPKIEIINSEKYNIQDAIIESKLLITDYSSVFFDFAISYKPIIFYPFTSFSNYNTTSFNYSNFGTISRTEKSLLNQLEIYLNNKCKLEQKYKENADTFFAYRDINNCNRIYECINTMSKK